jgi:hypothetical protein
LIFIFIVCVGFFRVFDYVFENGHDVGFFRVFESGHDVGCVL